MQCFTQGGLNPGLSRCYCNTVTNYTMCGSIIIDEHNDSKNNNISHGLLSRRASPWKGFLRKSDHVASEQLQAPKKKNKCPVIYHEPGGCHFCFSSGISLEVLLWSHHVPEKIKLR